MAAGDINGDGRTDLVIGNESGSNVFVALQPSKWIPSGPTDSWTTYFKPISGSASDILLANLTGSGDDLIFADASSSTISIYSKTGDGFSTNPSQIDLRTSQGLGTLTVGQLSNRTVNDILALSNTNANASIYLQNGNGAYGAYSNLTFPVDVSPVKAVIDRSVAGHEGVFILCQGPSGGNGTLEWFSSDPQLMGNANLNIFSGTGPPTSLSIGKVADGDVILASTLPSVNEVLLYDESTGRTWTVQTQSDPVTAIFGRFGSMKGDDLAVLNEGSRSISIYNGSQLGMATQPTVNITLNITDPKTMVSASVRNDGYDDLLIGYSGGCLVLYNSENGQYFDPNINETIGSSIAGNRTSICVGDLTGDGGADVALLNVATNNIEIYQWIPTGVPGDHYAHMPIANLSANILGVSHPMRSITTGDFGSSTDMAAITSDGELLIFLQPDYGFNGPTVLSGSNDRPWGGPWLDRHWRCERRWSHRYLGGIC